MFYLKIVLHETLSNKKFSCFFQLQEIYIYIYIYIIYIYIYNIYIYIYIIHIYTYIHPNKYVLIYDFLNPIASGGRTIGPPLSTFVKIS